MVPLLSNVVSTLGVDELSRLNLSKVFECGQGYVALSRVRSLAGLKIEGNLSKKSFCAHTKVSEFYAELKKRASQ